MVQWRQDCKQRAQSSNHETAVTESLFDYDTNTNVIQLTHRRLLKRTIDSSTAIKKKVLHSSKYRKMDDQRKTIGLTFQLVECYSVLQAWHLTDKRKQYLHKQY